MAKHYAIDVTKDHLVFSAAHFITIGEFCERLHGHNYRVAASIEGPLDADQLVFDFIALRDALQEMVLELDHHLLLPLRHPTLRVVQQNNEVEVHYAERRWVLPAEDCRLLPIEQSTAELLASWFVDGLRQRFSLTGLSALTVRVEENFGQWASCRMELTGPSE